MNEPIELGITRKNPPTWSRAGPAVYAPHQVQVLHSATTSTGTLRVSVQTAAWVLEAMKKLERLGRFRSGWDSYDGLPLQHGAKDLTLRVLEWLCREELPVPAVVLGSAGTVQLEWRGKGKDLEVELRADDSIEYVKVSPAGEIEEGEAPHAQAVDLEKLSGWLLHG